MAQTKKPTPHAPPAPEIQPTPSEVLKGGLNIQQELFCRYYTQNTYLFGNATRAYAEAYDYRLHELPDDDGYTDPDTKKRVPSTRQKAENTCAVEGEGVVLHQSTFPSTLIHEIR